MSRKMKQRLERRYRKRTIRNVERKLRGDVTILINDHILSHTMLNKIKDRVESYGPEAFVASITKANIEYGDLVCHEKVTVLIMHHDKVLDSVTLENHVPSEASWTEKMKKTS